MRLKGIFVEVLLLLISILSLAVWQPTHKQLIISSAPLPVPAKQKIALSGPLDLRRFNNQVLGVTVEVNPQDVAAAANKRRQEHNLPQLKINQILMKAAQLRAETIIRYQNFSHSDPYEGIELKTILPKLGYYYKYSAENIGMGGVSGEDFINGFFNSISHRNAILNPQFVETGVGIARGLIDGWQVVVAVQHFAIPADKGEWYGWEEENISYYQDLKKNILVNLANISKWLKESGGKNNYYRQWEKILERQKNIISTLLLRMHKGEPFTQRERSLIHEYNNNWAKAPKG